MHCGQNSQYQRAGRYRPASAVRRWGHP